MRNLTKLDENRGSRDGPSTAATTESEIAKSASIASSNDIRTQRRTVRNKEVDDDSRHKGESRAN